MGSFITAIYELGKYFPTRKESQVGMGIGDLLKDPDDERDLRMREAEKTYGQQIKHRKSRLRC